METRICRYCNEEHSIDFYETANIIKGVRYRRWKCRNCYREMKKDRRHGITEWLNELKKTLECKKCGENKYYMLDFHHRNPEEKEETLGMAVYRGWSKKRILKEIEKCDVYCSNHHRELHWGKNNSL